MATFSYDDCTDRPDYRLLQNGPITMFWNLSILKRERDWLQNHGYQVLEQSCLVWKSVDDFHTSISQLLHFPSYCGKNLDAFNDCLSDVSIPKENGLVLVFHRYDSFASEHPYEAQAILDILADQARYHLLFGRRLIILLQSDDPLLSFRPVGASAVMWNSLERLDSNRGVTAAE